MAVLILIGVDCGGRAEFDTPPTSGRGVSTGGSQGSGDIGLAAAGGNTASVGVLSTGGSSLMAGTTSTSVDAVTVVGTLYPGRTPVECKSQPDQGSCNDNVQRYYYDAVGDNCFPFAYSGCGGNANNFLTLTQCYTFCRNAIECSCPSGAIGCSTANGCAACPPGDPNYASGTACSSPGFYCDSGIRCTCVANDRGSLTWSCPVSI
jgi:hypothetical protein